MALFKNRKKAEQAEENKTKQLTPEQAPREVQKASLSSGRMASLFQKLYQWIFSVNTTAGVYQIESGEDTLAAEQIPVRGYYKDLLEKIEQEILPEQKENFKALFSPDSIQRAIKEGRTGITGSFCASDLGPESELAERGLKWYEFRAEWPKDVNLQNIVCVLSVRRITGDLDNGHPIRTSVIAEHSQNNETDWDAVRTRTIDSTRDTMSFEYDIENDCMYLHRLYGDSSGDRTTKNCLTSIAARSDFLISHESVKTVTNILHSGEGRGVEQVEIQMRKGAVFGAPFHHYRATCAHIEENGKPAWVVGRLEDIQEEVINREYNKEMAEELGSLLKTINISIFHINVIQDKIFRIVQKEDGFHREEEPQALSEYIRKRIASGRIAPEAKDEYLRWLENGYLQRKTAHGPYEFEARTKEMGDVDFRWYQESITAIKGRAGQYVRWRRDDTAAHQVRETEYRNKELEHIAKYNSQMLDSLASLVEFRNVESSDHIANVRILTQILMEDIQKRSPQYGITNKQLDMYLQAATMHDIGKITVPDYILNKQGRYTEEESLIMQRHTTAGAAIVDRLNIPGQEELKQCIRDVILHHHERYDGKGYPDGLTGDENPIGVQVVGLADVYDALVSERCYKKSYPSEVAVNMILDGQCGEFNPVLIESMKACAEEMKKVYEK